MTHRTDCQSLVDSGMRPCTCAGLPAPPHALTREQVEAGMFTREQLDKALALIFHKGTPAMQEVVMEVLAHDGALRQALTQQAQEIARQHQDFERATAKVMELRQLLAAMTAERDEIAARWKHDFELRCDEEEKNEQLNKQLAASQARVGELEEVINKADYRHIMDPPDGGDPTLAEKAKYLVDRISHANTQIATLQATLAERERDIDNLASQINDAHKAIERLETERDAARQDAARLREALGKEINTSRFESAPCYLCGYNGKLYFQPSTHPCAEWYHIAKQRALKGA